MLALETIFATIYAICIVFICCELGERLAIVYDQLDSNIGQFHWYLFPLEIQRLLPLIMINAQQPIILVCFGSISANRETFKKVQHPFGQNGKVKETMRISDVQIIHFRWWNPHIHTTRCCGNSFKNKNHSGFHCHCLQTWYFQQSTLKFKKRNFVSFIEMNLWCTFLFLVYWFILSFWIGSYWNGFMFNRVDQQCF